MTDPVDMTEINARQRVIDQQRIELADAACRQIQFDAIMAQFQAALMISHFNMLSLTYAALNPNLSSDDLKNIFGKTF